MSYDYWAIYGYGISMNNIPLVNVEKVNNLVKKINPNIAFEDDFNAFDDDTFCGNPYTSFAEFLADLDETDTLSWESDGQGEDYLLYTPKMPWSLKDNEPESYDEIDKRIINCVKLISDAEEDDVKANIDHVNTAGMG